jgi:hypothetical protein
MAIILPYNYGSTSRNGGGARGAKTHFFCGASKIFILCGTAEIFHWKLSMYYTTKHN